MSAIECNTGETHRLTIRRGGQAYRGLWRMTNDTVQVTSPYGVGAMRRQGREAPRALAEQVLGELAFRWCAYNRNHAARS